MWCLYFIGQINNNLFPSSFNVTSQFIDSKLVFEMFLFIFQVTIVTTRKLRSVVRRRTIVLKTPHSQQNVRPEVTAPETISTRVTVQTLVSYLPLIIMLTTICTILTNYIFSVLLLRDNLVWTVVVIRFKCMIEKSRFKDV